jgi:hypothetical protein
MKANLKRKELRVSLSQGGVKAIGGRNCGFKFASRTGRPGGLGVSCYKTFLSYCLICKKGQKSLCILTEACPIVGDENIYLYINEIFAGTCFVNG